MSATRNRSRARCSIAAIEPAANEAEADVVLLNTCSVRDMAEQKALGKMGMLGKIARERPETVFGFLGCMAQARGAELLKLRAARRSRRRDAEISSRGGLRRRVGREKTRRRMDDPRFSIVDTEEEAGSQETIREHTLRARQATAFVSIMQGCNMHCTFCIVPRTRGAERSRTIPEIVEGSARAGRARSERGDASRPDRESLRAARISKTRWERALSCSCSRRCTKSTASSGSASPHRIRSVFAPISSRPARAAEAL